MHSNDSGVEHVLSHGYCWRGIDDDHRHQGKAGSHARSIPRTGDSGQTDLLGERVTKDDPRINLIGTLDETTSHRAGSGARAG